MKKLIPILVVSLLAITGIFFVLKQYSSEAEAKDTTTRDTTAVENDIPPMIFTMADGSTKTLKDISGKLVVVLYQPDCDHCQREASAISEHLSSFDAYKVYFITVEPFDVIEKFANDYRLSGNSNIFFGRTEIESIINNFGQISAPSVYVYTQEGKLKKNFNGETPIEDILQSL